MISRPYLRDMALYNKWQNETLYGLCADMTAGERLRDRRMFFKSIHGTLNHILLVDQVILDFINSGVRPKWQPDQILHEEFEDLTAVRQAFDQRLLELADTVEEDWLTGTLAFPSPRPGETANIPRAYFLMQMFNHQTHHRSQITSELHKEGIDYGTTDMPFNPYMVY